MQLKPAYVLPMAASHHPHTSVNTHSIGVTWRGLDPCFVQNISKVETTLKNLQHGAKVGVLCCHVTTSAVLQPLVAPVKGGNIITSREFTDSV